MIKQIKQLNVETTTQGGGDTATVVPPVKPGGEDYSMFEGIGKAFSDPNQKETPVKPEGDQKPDPQNQQKTDPAKETPQGTATPSTEDDNKDKTTPEVQTEQPVVLKLKEDVQLGQDNYNFISLGKEQGFEVKEDNVKSYNEALKSFVESQKKDAWSGNFLKELEKEDPKVQEAYLLAKEGKSFQEIEAPVAQINGLLSLDNYNLVKAELEGRGLSGETLEKQLEELTEQGKLDEFGTFIRGELNQSKDAKIKERTEFFSGLKTKHENRLAEERKSQLTALENEFKNVNEFMGLKLAPTVSQGVLRNFEQGKYNDLLTNPKNILQAILFYELGETAQNEIRQKAQAKVIERNMQDLTNTPPVQQGNNNIRQPDKKGGMFDSISESFAKKK